MQTIEDEKEEEKEEEEDTKEGDKCLHVCYSAIRTTYKCYAFV